jgi:hypothetical protein
MAQLAHARRRRNATPALLPWLHLNRARSARVMLDIGLPSILALVTSTPIIAGLSYAERMPLSRRPGCDWPEDPAATGGFNDIMFPSAPMIATRISGPASAIEATAVSYCAGRSSPNAVQDWVRHCFVRCMGAVWTSTRPEDRSGILWRMWMTWCCRRIVHRPHREECRSVARHCERRQRRVTAKRRKC